MRLQIETGGLSLSVLCSGYDQSDEIGGPGGGNATVPAALYVKLRKDEGFDTYSVDEIETIEAQLADDPDMGLSLSNDDLIVFLNAAANARVELPEIEFDGLAYWFCHDVIHSQRDVIGGSVSVSDTSENRALYEGAVLAALVGVPVSEIVREVASAEKAYVERWKDSEPNALDRFLRHCKFSLDN